MTGLVDSFRRLSFSVHGFRVIARAGMLRGVPLRIALRTVRDVPKWGPLVSPLRRTATLRPHAPALIDERGPVTYAELDQRSDALAGAFWDHGVRPGHHIGLLCRDHRGMLEALLACSKLGVHIVLINTGFAGPQLVDVLTRERVQVIVHDEEFTSLLRSSRVRLPRIVAWSTEPDPEAPTLDELIASTPVRDLPPPPELTRVIVLTSGTTGRPRGTRRDIRSGLAAGGFLERIPLRAKESLFIASPLFHAVGYSQLLLGFGLGCTIVLHRRFDPHAVAHAVRTYRCSTLVLVPTMLQRLLELDHRVLAESLASLRIVLSSGAPLPPVLCERATSVLGDVLYNLYGSTEASVVTVATPEQLRATPGTAGTPPRGSTIRLIDDAGKTIARPYVSGRIFAGGPMTFDGYTDDFHTDLAGDLIATGDVGHFDENGWLFVDGRDDDMIISGGENVFPSEVENLIARHFQVKDVAVIGVPDEEFGQRLRAYVVAIPGSDLTAAEIREYVRNSLAKHKVPREVIMVGSVPRNATGKLLRRNLVGYVR